MDAEVLSAVGLYAREIKGVYQSECRIELRLTLNDDFVAWFCKGDRMSDKAVVRSVSAQFVQRDSLSSEQVSVVEAWLRSELSTTF